MCAGARCVQGSEVRQGDGYSCGRSLRHLQAGGCVGEALGSSALPGTVSPEGGGRAPHHVPTSSRLGWLSAPGKLHHPSCSMGSPQGAKGSVRARGSQERPWSGDKSTHLQIGHCGGSPGEGTGGGWAKSPLLWDCCWWRDGAHRVLMGCQQGAHGPGFMVFGCLATCCSVLVGDSHEGLSISPGTCSPCPCPPLHEPSQSSTQDYPCDGLHGVHSRGRWLARLGGSWSGDTVPAGCTGAPRAGRCRGSLSTCQLWFYSPISCRLQFGCWGSVLRQVRAVAAAQRVRVNTPARLLVPHHPRG